MKSLYLRKCSMRLSFSFMAQSWRRRLTPTKWRHFTYNRYQSWLIACKTGCVFISTWSKRFVASWKLHFHETGPLIMAIGKSSISGIICCTPRRFRFVENLHKVAKQTLLWLHYYTKSIAWKTLSAIIWFYRINDLSRWRFSVARKSCCKSIKSTVMRTASDSLILCFGLKR